MRRCFTTRLTFQRLLCGDKLALENAVAVQEAASTFRAHYPVAPLPVPIAAALGRSYVQRGEPRRAVALLASHPSSRSLARELIQLLSQDTTVETDALLQMVEAIRAVSSVTSCELLCSLAGRVQDEKKLHAVKQRLMREVRESPQLAGTLLHPLCKVSDLANVEDRRNAADALDIALQRSFVSPRDYGHVLALLSRGGEHRKVLALWLWMRHSSARWDKTAASAIIISASLSRKMNVAIGAIQSLAEANEDPTTEAQKYFIRYLASRFPPLSRYADQLVRHWHSGAQLWTTEARVVGVELLFVHYHSKDFQRLRECLLDADGEATTDEAKQAILRVRGIPYILIHFAADIATEPWLKNFYRSGMQMKDLGDFPQVLAALGSLARHMMEEVSFVRAMQSVKMSAEAFEVATKFVVNDIHFKNAEETLQFINRMAEAMSQEVPADVSSWLQLLGPN
ncbi:hypothetical protein DQ04_01761120 [Trypanosoma grayi]|uniref:hypothetical protein n=1 Tax=Trypanosoma grayi TaxID=71804 RepID=UPI0004F4500D|nr:hypothetical protein DQ04_01761120 [Trypanosoma grayi]KEG12377.1 hypothetical protein DQ04_01761120 [Trypanosoma grayi]